MIIAGPPSSPNKNRAFEKYVKAYKRWTNAIHRDMTLGPKLVRFKVSLDNNIFSFSWFNSEEYKAIKKEIKHFTLEAAISELDLAYFMLSGWSRKVGRTPPPKSM